MQRENEIERKFAVSEQGPVPDLPEGFSYGVTQEFSLHAIYFDTAELTLAAARRTLRHRSGGDDDGWHLKLPPVDGARTEVTLPPDGQSGAVPQELRAEVADLVGDDALVPVAELRTMRRQTEIRGGTVVVAVVADDTVTARRLPGQPERTWRELEVELTGSDTDVLDAITACWAGQGVTVSSSVSKLAQALGTQ